MAGEEAPCLAAPALSLPLRPCCPRGDDRSREGEPSDTSRSEPLGPVASVAGRRNWMWSWPGATPTFDPPIRQTRCWWYPRSTADRRPAAYRPSSTPRPRPGPRHQSRLRRRAGRGRCGCREPRTLHHPSRTSGDGCAGDPRLVPEAGFVDGARARHGASLSRRTRGDPLVPAPGVHLRRPQHEPPRAVARRHTALLERCPTTVPALSMTHTPWCV